MNKKKVLFLIHDLGQGGAEKVLVNLVNNIDKNRFEVYLVALFGGGVNEQFLRPEVHFSTVFRRMIPGNSRLMKLLSPGSLYKLFIKDKYDIEVSYLEGPSARIISGSNNGNSKKVCWIHSNHFSLKEVTFPFRNNKEAQDCYMAFDRIVCVSQVMRNNFCQWMPVNDRCIVLYNTVESEEIKQLANEPVPEMNLNNDLRVIAVGSLKQVKGFDRLLRIIKRLIDENHRLHLYILGKGPLKQNLESYIHINNLDSFVTLLGYQTNPYKYIANSDLFVCSSYSEGFSTAVTESIIVGTPVCTVDVSGMREILGENNEYGYITGNNEEELYKGLKQLIDNPDVLSHYKEKAIERSAAFDTRDTVAAVEEMFESL